MNVKRYEWEDALVDAQTTGLIPNGALLLALKLARAINWSPKNGRPAGLYWKNEEALASVGASRATYFKHRESLLETGFFVQDKGNLLPTMPEKSLLETTESLLKTEKSLVDNPLSEDTFTDDSLSEETAVAADASPAVPNVRTEQGESRYHFILRDDSSLNAETGTAPIYYVDLDGVTKDAESLVETDKEGAMDIKRILTPGEKQVFADLKRQYSVSDEKASEALVYLQTVKTTGDIYEAVTEALVASGAVAAESLVVW